MCLKNSSIDKYRDTLAFERERVNYNVKLCDAGNKYLSDGRTVPPTAARLNLLVLSTLARGARTLIHFNHACNFYSLNDKLIEILTHIKQI